MLSCSDKFKQEYCCTIVRIGECWPIEGADRIQRTLVNGMDMVISKEIRPGDIMIYAGNETQLHQDFLRVNNLYGIGDFELNDNHDEVSSLIAEGRNDEAKALCGFFNKHGRVKMLKLKGVYSFGFLFTPSLLIKWMPELKDFDFESKVGTDFDTVGKTLFVKAYVPIIREARHSGKGPQAADKGPKFDSLIGEFPFHYDTKQFQRYIEQFKPDDMVSITVKMHGTSAIYRRTECKIHKPLKWWQSVANFFGKAIGKTFYLNYTIGQDVIYASRTQIRNRYKRLKLKKGESAIVLDEYGYIYTQIAGLLDRETTVYGEIIGYKPGGNKCIQKGYDYGYQVGTCGFMPYRVVSHGVELTVPEVIGWTRQLQLKDVDKAKNWVIMPLVYHGRLKNLYRDIPVDENWHQNLLARMKKDKNILGMELDEPLCNERVPREGVVIRIDNDAKAEGFKLKCAKFLNKESKDVDAGIIDEESLEVAEA